jgi:hypothetical protein
MSDLWAQWNKYPTYNEYIAMMEKFQADYPDLCKIEEFGESVQGKKLLAAKISDSVSLKETEPEFLYTSTIHGNELVGYVLSLRLIDYLLSNYRKDVFVTRLVDSIEIWICPLLNPDGTYYGGDNIINGARRYNSNGKDLNRNFYKIPGAGNSESPEKETSELYSFLKNHNFVMGAHFLADIECALYPWQAVNRKHPDQEWFQYVSKNYADTAQANSPPGYFEYAGGTGFGNGYSEYIPRTGTISDYLLYYQHCRSIEIWLSNIKNPPADSLPDYWEYNYRSVLHYMEQALFGMRGVVTDSSSGRALRAKVYIENHDVFGDSSWVYSDTSFNAGNFHRLIFEGVYTITFSVPDYDQKTFTDVPVTNNRATVLNVKLNYDVYLPHITVSSPQGGDKWEKGKTYEITWQSDDVNFFDEISLYNNGSRVCYISTERQVIHSYNWEIPNHIPSGNNYKIYVYGRGNWSDTYDLSDSTFSIIDPVQIEKPLLTNQKLLSEGILILQDRKSGNVKIILNHHQDRISGLEIFSLKGKRIKSFNETKRDKDCFSVLWDCRDNNRVLLPKGCYIIRFDFGHNILAKHFMLSR